jgi:excisionase family DNA binding protein
MLHFARPLRGDSYMLEELKAKRTALTVKELAKILSLSEREIYKLAASYQIPHFKIGTSVRFDPPAVIVWLEAKMLTPGVRRSPSYAYSHRERLSDTA